MKYRHLTRLVTFAGIFLAATATLPAAVIYSDNFSFTGDLNGRTPTTTTGGNTWTAGNGTSSAYLGDGSVVNVDPSGHTRAYLDFTPETGTIYTLKGEMAQDADSTDWLTLGFAGSNPADDGFFANGGISTLLLRDDGEVDWYQGPALNNTVDGGTISGFAVNTFYEFELVLDTTGSQWTVDAFAAGNQLDLNGAAAGSTFTWATNPTIGSVMLSTHEDAVGSYDNFELTVVPEPSAGLLLLLGLLPVPFPPPPRFLNLLPLFVRRRSKRRRSIELRRLFLINIPNHHVFNVINISISRGADSILRVAVLHGLAGRHFGFHGSGSSPTPQRAADPGG